jgi:hypothetical protein
MMMIAIIIRVNGITLCNPV